MNNDIYTGKLVRLVIFDPSHDSAMLALWGRDPEFQRLLGSEPVSLWTAQMITENFEKDADNSINFAIQCLEDTRTIGLVGLSTPDQAGNSWVSICIGDRQDWGKGFGTEAMRLAVNFAFCELNIERITLDVFEYNPRAIRSYEKAGFQHEGRQRQFLLRGGKRWDLLFMGILRSEWMQLALNHV